MTATERRSILELARLVGYKLRPGVAAASTGVHSRQGLPRDDSAGTRAQSTTQFFETRWICPSATPGTPCNTAHAPQLITLASDRAPTPPRATHYTSREFPPTSDRRLLLIVLGDDAACSSRFVESVDAQANLNRTEVTLQPAAPQSLDTAQGTLSARWIRLSRTPRAFSRTATWRVSGCHFDRPGEQRGGGCHPGGCRRHGARGRSASPAAARYRGEPRIHQLEAWTSGVLFVLTDLVQIIPEIDGNSVPTGQPLPLTATWRLRRCRTSGISSSLWPRRLLCSQPMRNGWCGLSRGRSRRNRTRRHGCWRPSSQRSPIRSTVRVRHGHASAQVRSTPCE